jgi:hypothetical protein
MSLASYRTLWRKLSGAVKWWDSYGAAQAPKQKRQAE